MKKQMLLTCAVVAMAAGKAQAGEFVASGTPTTVASSPPISTVNEYASASTSTPTSWTSDGSAANFNKSHTVPATQTIMQRFVYAPFDPVTDPSFPSGRVTRTATYEGKISASKYDYAGSAFASAKVVFSLTGTGSKGDTINRGVDGGSSITYPTGSSFTSSETLPALLEDGVPTITVETTIGVESSMTARATWTGWGNPPNAMATSGYNYIRLSSVTCVKVDGTTAALPSPQRYAYARVR